MPPQHSDDAYSFPGVTQGIGPWEPQTVWKPASHQLQKNEPDRQQPKIPRSESLHGPWAHLGPQTRNNLKRQTTTLKMRERSYALRGDTCVSSIDLGPGVSVITRMVSILPMQVH